MKQILINIFLKIKNLKISFLKEKIILNYLKNKYLIGDGLEIGPGRYPYKKKNVIYVDKFPEHYPSMDSNKMIKADASKLPFKDSYFDFLISAHCLEHCPDTILTLKEWIRVIKPGGNLFLILPHAERTFDKGRKLTDLQHHIIDYKNKADIYDKNPLDEWGKISLPNAKPNWLTNKNTLNKDGSLNFKWMAEDGKIHYHAWTQDEIAKLGQYLNLKVLFSSDYLPTREDSFIVVFNKI